jgi:FtsZ-interacting cell division protein YlmF
MPGTFTCRHCGKSLPLNPCSKNQKYCSDRSCQNARRNRSSKRKLKKSKKSRDLRKARNKRWRDKSPAHEYMDHYRKNCPEYESENRKRQLDRNRNRRKSVSPSMIVKTYALTPHPFDDAACIVFSELKDEKIVKTYTYGLQLQSQRGIEANLAQKTG